MGRDIPFYASLEVQELTGARGGWGGVGGGGEGAALGSEAVTEGGGEGDEVVISLSFQDMNWQKVVWRKLSGSNKAWSEASEATERWES